MKQPKAGFSLAELLVVIVIISVLAAIAMPAFNTMMGGTGLQAAAQDVKMAMSQARQYAVMNNTPTQFVIASALSELGLQDKDKWMRAYSVYDVKKEKFIKPWKYLPEGLVFDKDNDSFKDRKGSKSSNLFEPDLPLTSVTHKMTSLVTGNNYIQFGANGRARWVLYRASTELAAGYVTVVISEGYTNPATEEYFANPTIGGTVGVSAARNTGRATIEVAK